MAILNLQDAANWAQIIGLLGLPLTVIAWLVTRDRLATFWKKWRVRLFWVLGAALVIALYFAGYFHWLVYPVKSPLWILLLFGGAFAALLTWNGWQWLKKSSGSPLVSSLVNDWHNYVNDEVFGVRWTWTYRNERIHNDFGAFCPRPNCRCRLTEVSNPQRMSLNIYQSIPITLKCPRCGFSRDLTRISRRFQDK